MSVFITKKWRMSRRQVLRGLGATIALPWLNCMADETPALPKPKRSVFLYIPNGVNTLKGPDMGVMIITHYQRILHEVKPDFVHVLYKGRIVKEGGSELVETLEQRGYGWIEEEVEAAA